MFRNISNSITIFLFLGSISISSFLSYYFTAEYKDNKYQRIILEREKIANDELKKERERSLEVERNLVSIKDELEKENARKKKIINDLYRKYNDAISSGYRLRDPGATSSNCSNGNSSDSKSPSRADFGGRGAELSEEASRFLLSEAARADEVVQELNLCKAWVREVKKKLDEFSSK